MADAALRLENQLCFALHAASRAMVAVYQPLLAGLGVTYPQYLVLLVLWAEDGASVSRIGELLYLDSATLTPLLKRLEARGLIRRRRRADDQRVVEIFLTAAGKRLRGRARPVPRAAFARTGLAPAELAELRATLQALTQKLQSPPPAASRADRRSQPTAKAARAR